MENRRAQGTKGENLARTLLEEKGYRFIVGNYNCRWGEIDLVMSDRDTLVFVEVRTRRSLRYGHPLESITSTKQRRLVRTAKDYLLHHPHKGPMRFDVVAILMTPEIQTQHLENALETSTFF